MIEVIYNTDLRKGKHRAIMPWPDEWAINMKAIMEMIDEGERENADQRTLPMDSLPPTCHITSLKVSDGRIIPLKTVLGVLNKYPKISKEVKEMPLFSDTKDAKKKSKKIDPPEVLPENL